MILLLNTRLINQIRDRLNQFENERHELHLYDYYLHSRDCRIKINPTACFILVKILIRHGRDISCQQGSLVERSVNALDEVGLIQITSARYIDSDWYPHCVLTHLGYVYASSIFKHPWLSYYLEYLFNFIFRPMPFFGIGNISLGIAISRGIDNSPLSFIIFIVAFAFVLVGDLAGILIWFNLMGDGSRFIFHESKLSKRHFAKLCSQNFIDIRDIDRMMITCDNFLFIHRHPIRDTWRAWQRL